MNRKSPLFIFKPFSSPLIYSYITLFYFLTRTTLCYCYVHSNSNFTACEPKTCGNQTIRFPFYIRGTQQPFCGYPGFGISCDNNLGFPILNLTNTFYIIDKIFYENQSLRVSNVVFSRSDINKGCLSPTQNLTFPINMFNLAHNQTHVVLFFGCDSTKLPKEFQKNTIGCFSENKTSSVVALYGDDKNTSFVSKNCRGRVVSAMVEDGVKGEIEESLRNGFLLNWIAADCSECYNSGGRCGFDSSIYSFRCYCTDRIHASICDPVRSLFLF